MAEWNAARSQSRFGAEVVRHLVAQPVHLRQHQEKLGTDLRGTLEQSSMQQQLQQHPSGEAAVGSRAPDLGPFELVQGACCNSRPAIPGGGNPFDQLGDRPSSLVRGS